MLQIKKVKTNLLKTSRVFDKVIISLEVYSAGIHLCQPYLEIKYNLLYTSKEVCNFPHRQEGIINLPKSEASPRHT